MTAEAPKGLPTARGLLLRWTGWFGLLNGGLAALVGIRYLLAFGAPADLLATAYVALAFVSQFAVLGFLPLMLVLGSLALLLPRRGLILTIGVVLAALGLTTVVVDTNIFAQYRFHLGGMTIVLFDTATWVMAAVIFVAVIGFQAMLAGNVWKFVSSKQNRRGGLLATVLILMLLGGQGIHIWADATAYSSVTSFNRFLPAYFPMKAKRSLAKLGWVDPEEVERARLLRQADAPDAGQLNYPLNPLSCVAPEQPWNVVFVLIDALRPDKVTAEGAPTIHALSQRSQLFNNHYSGGNSSRMGIFSMFYGIPSTYWQAFYDTQRQPLVMQQMLAEEYEVTAFSSVGFGSPAQIDRTLFAAIDPTARKTGVAENGLDRNQSATKYWQDWFEARNSDAPFFSFLYYDPGNASKDSGGAGGANELERKIAGYENGLKRIDADVAAMLAELDASGQRDNTIVIVTGDHGYEFDELGLGYIGHASNYAAWQMKTPLIMDWPGRAPQHYEHRSAHQDLPSTLLQDALGCSNPASDYSSGENLFAGKDWRWLLAGSYNSHAIIEPDKIVVTNPGGFIEVLGPDYKPDRDLRLDAGVMEEAVIEMRRFYK